MVESLVRFASCLREGGVPVTPSDTIDAARVVSLVDIGDRAQVRCALRIAFKIQPEHVERFERVFGEHFDGDRPYRSKLPPVAPMGKVRGGHSVAVVWATNKPDDPIPAGNEAGFSPQELLRRKPFADYTEADLAAMRRVLERLARRLTTRRSRRLIPAASGNYLDLRRTLRRAVGNGAEAVDLAWKRRAIERQQLVVLCDTSGSMDIYGRFLLTFLLSLPALARDAEIFVFNTQLVRLTRELTRANIEATLARIAIAVPDWSGGTRIGECLDEFVRHYCGRLVGGRTQVLILSDGLDRGDVDLLARAMLRIRRRSRRVLWLNPLLSDARYCPDAAGMKAALPYIDQFLPAHDLQSLERLGRLLAA